ncbi:GSU2403 family nucleotidyltransferase fold protein [Corallococcus interemptor]|uniref:GSU2403 family nucleotidyltransferase fold protein n=1 Tax=Corallococcus interemptor TaxID=2316720 RepID=UPI003D05DF3B
MSEVDELYVMARRVLLDALDALGTHREAVVLVGAQAIYLRVGDTDLAVSPFTTDGDLAIDPAVLAESPPLEKSLKDAGFLPSRDVGIWIAKRSTKQHGLVDVSIDLLVPASVSPGGGRRTARLPGHDTRAARIVKGLDGALVDADVLRLDAIAHEEDARSFEVRVAGPAALLVAKVHKIQDRRNTGRQSDKDALDVLRLLRGTETDVLAVRYRRLLEDGRSTEAARAGLELLAEQFSAPNGIGIDMAVRSVGELANADEIAGSCMALSDDLLKALKG